ncbi:GAF and ANTAR domain-containing protein [Streptomyces fructofermentans]|uniref:GAF and ANTAR domain-containing protein n=1 Tax=Streptomyces fructofermentans TaxID=152141 RepID=UPI0037B45AD4
MTREQQLTEAFVDLSDTLADDADPMMLLDRLARYCVDLASVDAAGVMLANARGQLRPAVSTDARATLTEVMQAQIRQGPCIDAYTTGRQVHAVGLRNHQERWPVFVPLALAAGYEGAHALPLHVRGQALGALNLFSCRPSAFSGTETRLLRALADVATTAVLTWDRAPLRPDGIATRVQAALSGKALIDTACGMLAATAGISPHEAARHLFVHAARTHLRPTDVADQLVRRLITPERVLDEVSDRGE